MTDVPIDPEEFERAFAAADPSTQTAFVADLWEAFGWETSIEGAVVVAERSEPVSETRRLLVSAGEYPPDEPDVDAIVTPGGSVPVDANVPVIDAGEIRERALYGASRSTTAEPFRRHLGHELVAERGVDPDPGSSPEKRADPPTDVTDDQEDTTPETDGSEDSGAPGEETGSSDPTAVTAGRAAGAFLIVALVVGSVGFAAGAGMLPPETVLGDRGPSNATDATPTPDRETVTNGSLARYGLIQPTCERPPELVIKIQVDAFGRNEELGGNTGIWIAYQFASPGNKATTGPQASFARLIRQQYPIMLNHESVEYGPLRPRDGESRENGSRTLTQRVTLTDANGTESTFLWSVEKQESGEYDGCWMTSSVRRAPGGGDTGGQNR